MNIASNPWSFVSTDVLTATPTASPNGLVLNADGTVTMTTGVTSFAVGNGVTVIGATNSAYNGFYRVLIVTSTSVYQLAPQFLIPKGTTGSGGGTAILCQYVDNVRIEDIQWQNVPVSSTLTIYDRNGNLIWTATTPANAGANPPNYNRSKLFWVHGVSIAVLSSGSTVLMTIN